MSTAEYISNIQRFSLDDGPGIRTTVFLKGCNLRCAWCHNPESISFSPVLQFFPQVCTGCGRCAVTCQHQAHQVTGDIHTFDRQLCKACGLCVSGCRTGALKLSGEKIAPRTLFDELLKDKKFFTSSGGGITFSGGEPALKVDYIIAVAQLCALEGISVALDTAGNVPFEQYKQLLLHISLFLYDIKCFDNNLHKQWTGVENSLILENLRSLDALGAKYTVRVPIIPKFNTDYQEQERIARYLSSLSSPGLIQLLPYHAYGEGKYQALGLGYELQHHPSPDSAQMDEFLKIYHRQGLNAEIA